MRQIFAASQHDGMDIEDKIVNNVHNQSCMNFAGFLEGVARLGLLKYQNGTLTDYECTSSFLLRKVSAVALLSPTWFRSQEHRSVCFCCSKDFHAKLQNTEGQMWTTVGNEMNCSIGLLSCFAYAAA